MSFEPTLVIRKSHLELNRPLIERSEYYDLPIENKNAWAELRRALSADVISFAEIDLVLIEPQLTSHNGNVRKLLDSLDIEFKMWY